MRAFLRFAFAAAFVVGLATSSHADTIIWHIPGILDSSPADPLVAAYLRGLGIAPRQQLDFHLTIDTAAPDLCPSPDVGFYAAGRSLTFDWNGKTGAASGFFVQRFHHALIGGCFPDPSTSMLVLAFPLIDGAPLDIALFWDGAPGDALPFSPPPFGAFWLGAGLRPGWYGSLGPADVELVPPTVVPEPGTLLLLSTGLLIVAARRRHHR